MEEDDALYQVIKTDSVAQIGYFGSRLEYLYVLSHMETFSIYTFEDADPIKQYGDVRGNSKELSLEYCINCNWDPLAEKLYLTAGSRK